MGKTKNGENRLCLTCSKEFYIQQCFIKDGKGKFCSRRCYELSKVGVPMHSNTKAALSKITVWNKGITYGRSNWLLKTNPSLYRNIHKKIYRMFGRPTECEECKDTTLKNIQWANISAKYLLDRSDWKQLCRKCHMQMDKVNQLGKEVLKCKI